MLYKNKKMKKINKLSSLEGSKAGMVRKRIILPLIALTFAFLLIANVLADCEGLNEQECGQNKNCVSVYDSYLIFNKFARCDYSYDYNLNEVEQSKGIFDYVSGFFSKISDFITGKSGVAGGKEQPQKKTIYINSGSKLLAKVDVTKD